MLYLSCSPPLLVIAELGEGGLYQARVCVCVCVMCEGVEGKRASNTHAHKSAFINGLLAATV